MPRRPPSSTGKKSIYRSRTGLREKERPETTKVPLGGFAAEGEKSGNRVYRPKEEGGAAHVFFVSETEEGRRQTGQSCSEGVKKRGRLATWCTKGHRRSEEAQERGGGRSWPNGGGEKIDQKRGKREETSRQTHIRLLGRATEWAK